MWWRETSIEDKWYLSIKFHYDASVMGNPSLAFSDENSHERSNYLIHQKIHMESNKFKTTQLDDEFKMNMYRENLR